MEKRAIFLPHTAALPVTHRCLRALSRTVRQHVLSRHLLLFFHIYTNTSIYVCIYIYVYKTQSHTLSHQLMYL